MDTVSSVFGHASSSRWTAESIGRLCNEDIRQLRDNAVRLGAEEVVSLCDAALGNGARNVVQKSTGSRPAGKAKLVSRRAAFQMRGVMLHAGMSSWGGVRESDKTVVFSLWAEDIRREGGACTYLLWAPNRAAAERPWSDTPAGKERLEHCKIALEQGRAEGLLVYGQRLEGFLPEERAQTVAGIDPAVVIVLHVVRRGDEYWATWGGRAPAAESAS